jgi:hypothetical protein
MKIDILNKNYYSIIFGISIDTLVYLMLWRW